MKFDEITSGTTNVILLGEYRGVTPYRAPYDPNQSGPGPATMTSLGYTSIFPFSATTNTGPTSSGGTPQTVDAANAATPNYDLDPASYTASSTNWPNNPTGDTNPANPATLSPGTFGSAHSGGAQFVAVDGAVRFLFNNVDPQVFSLVGRASYDLEVTKFPDND